MREISISTAVYAKIWSLRQENEESEDAILTRVLGCVSIRPHESKRGKGIGVSDPRFNVHFEEGFEIFRRYLRTEYRATAIGGQWQLQNNGRRYGGLNELSRAIGAKTENAWMNWNYLDSKSIQRKVSELRDGTTIGVRANPEMNSSTEETENMNVEVSFGAERKTWAEDIVTALEQIGGRRAPLNRIYDETRKVRIANGRSVPPTFDAVVRERLESHSSDSDSFKGGPDLFCMPDGKGAGVWGLRRKQ